MSRHCTRRPPTTPLSTSPLPAVAIPQLPDRLINFSPSAAAIIVRKSLSTQVTLYKLANSPATPMISSCISAMLFFISLDISPRCGVTMTGILCSLSKVMLSDMILSASASITRGISAVFSTVSTNILALSDFERPGPITTASAHSSSVSSALADTISVQSSASGKAHWIIERLHSGVIIFTSPAPLLYAAFAESTAAPAILRLPAITNSFPKVPLLECAGLLSSFFKSDSSRALTDGRLPQKLWSSMPIGTTLTRPQ